MVSVNNGWSFFKERKNIQTPIYFVLIIDEISVREHLDFYNYTYKYYINTLVLLTMDQKYKVIL